MRCVWFLTLFSLFSSGCIRTAVVQFWEPAAIDVDSMNRIVVLEFSGEHGKSVATALSSQLWQNEFYTVVDQGEISRDLQLAGYAKGHTSEDDVHEILTKARSSRIDGVLLGEVVNYRCEDKHVRRTAINASSSGNGAPNRMLGGGASAGLGVDLRETLVREASVSVAFRLMDVETGEVRAAREVSHTFTGESDGNGDKLATQAEILEDLTQQCVNDIVGMLAPHQVSSEIQLAVCDVWTRGRRDVKEGNQQAELGNWDVAEQHWHNALEVEPNNHAALFNLSIAADHRRDYAQAEELAMQALRLQHKTCYTAGLDKIRSHRSAAEKSAEQRDARVATYIDEIWR